jgi:hypothetical protein
MCVVWQCLQALGHWNAQIGMHGVLWWVMC